MDWFAGFVMSQWWGEQCFHDSARPGGIPFVLRYRRFLKQGASLCTRATAPPRTAKPPERYAVDGAIRLKKAAKIALIGSLDTRLPCEPEIAKLWQVEKLATQRVSELRHRGRIQPWGIRNRNIPKLPPLSNCSRLLHERFEKSDKLNTHTALL